MNEQIWLEAYPENIDWQADIPVKPLHALLDDTVDRFPQNPFLDFLGKKYSYGEIGDMVRRAAAGFQKLGVGKGVKVGLFLPNCPQFVISYFAILKAGGTVVNYSPLYAEDQLLHQIEDSQTDIMVTLNLEALYPKMKAMLEQTRLKTLVIGTMPEVLPFPKSLLFPLFKRSDIADVANDSRHLAFAQLLNNDGTFEPPTIDAASDIAVLQYTGGTTGVSKGAMLSHANLYANTVQSARWFEGLEPGQERMMGVLPFFHVFAMTVVMNLSIYIGAEIIMHPRFELEPVLKDLSKKRPTLFPGVPTMYTAINHHPDLASYDLTAIKICLSGGAPLPVEVKQRFEELTGASLREGYGLTETSPVACANPIAGVSKEGSIGLPLPGTSIFITDREDPTKFLPQGEDGEICVQGPQVMMGYWGRPEDSAEAIIDGRLRTGDVGYMDEQGYTFIIDRMKDLILVGGFNVYPRHVEEGVYQHPAVEECTVIGVDDEYRGQAVKAFVKLKAGHTLTSEELLSFLQEKLGKHEMPRHVEFRDELPKTMIGKLSKKELVAEEAEKGPAA
ncbi:MAG: long-chain fatty acid--CoA ligase [Alphaproteobacteria bacterium]|jgi:long-chain acyl-CoA synthetase|nr:dicarboxylate--CoA ligase PimA [Rhodospirillaceae bacterium]MDP6403743.1 long-chain fatty acid--CoA ligase [Alphaproteobacteria bacterium]MDP6624522.1 long-chain fatty acid--CoA ligase [Alphaproteobacteria bacterium]|tara:strand:- start:5119 stop:6798 length:1680 start_codon:yes stop_codon:yes gene_type:complete